MKGAWTKCEWDSLAALECLFRSRGQHELSVGTEALRGTVPGFSLCLAHTGTDMHHFGPLPLACWWRGASPSPYIIAMVLPWQTVTQGSHRHCMIIKMSIQKENITFVNVHAHNIGAPKYIKQLLTDLLIEINGNAMTEEYINTLTIWVGWASKQKSSEEKLALTTP